MPKGYTQKDYVIQNTQSQLESAKQDFITHARWLARNLVDAADELEKENVFPNSSGICQTQAHTIDDACLKMKLLKELLTKIEKI